MSYLARTRVLLSLAMLGFLLPSFAVEAAEKVAVLVGVKGRVEAQSSSGHSRLLVVGSELFEQDTVITGDEGRAKLRFSEGGNEVVVGTRSRLFVQRASAHSSNPGTSLYLESGEVRSHVKRKYTGRGDDVFEVRTPNAVSGVRGTVFQVSFQNQNTVVATLEGAVSVRVGNSAPALVYKGQFTRTVQGLLQNVRPISRDAALKRQLYHFERATPKSTESGKNGSVGKDAALASSASKQAHSLSQKFGFPVESAMNFVKTDSIKEVDKQKAIRNLGNESPRGFDQMPAPSGGNAGPVKTVTPVVEQRPMPVEARPRVEQRLPVENRPAPPRSSNRSLQ